MHHIYSRPVNPDNGVKLFSELKTTAKSLKCLFRQISNAYLHCMSLPSDVCGFWIKLKNSTLLESILCTTGNMEFGMSSSIRKRAVHWLVQWQQTCNQKLLQKCGNDSLVMLHRWARRNFTHHIWSFIFFPSNSIVLILKSMPESIKKKR